MMKIPQAIVRITPQATHIRICHPHQKCVDISYANMCRLKYLSTMMFTLFKFTLKHINNNQ